jgi:hypothetical protein
LASFLLAYFTVLSSLLVDFDVEYVA